MKDTDRQNNRGTCQEEELEQDAFGRQVLRDIWIKEGNNWDLYDTIEEQSGNLKQIERYSEAYRKRKQTNTRSLHHGRQRRPHETGITKAGLDKR